MQARGPYHQGLGTPERSQQNLVVTRSPLPHLSHVWPQLRVPLLSALCGVARAHCVRDVFLQGERVYQ
jgi:hypothetical protein